MGSSEPWSDPQFKWSLHPSVRENKFSQSGKLILNMNVGSKLKWKWVGSQKIFTPNFKAHIMFSFAKRGRSAKKLGNANPTSLIPLFRVRRICCQLRIDWFIVCYLSPRLRIFQSCKNNVKKFRSVLWALRNFQRDIPALTRGLAFYWLIWMTAPFYSHHTENQGNCMVTYPDLDPQCMQVTGNVYWRLNNVHSWKISFIFPCRQHISTKPRL